MTCPSCHRPVAMARPTCLYCGARLPADLLARAEKAVAAARAPMQKVALASPLGQGFAPQGAPAALDRVLLVVDVTGAPTGALIDLMGLTVFEAGLRARAGGLHLHRLGTAEDVKAQALVFSEAGLRALTLPEAEVRVAPIVATRGEQEDRRLRLRTSRGSRDVSGEETEVRAEDVLLVVEGPIQREYQPETAERKKVRSATLDVGYRFHLHRRSDPRPVELDPASFSFGPRGPVAGSSLLELKSWIAGLGDVPSDDGFRRLPVALAPALPEEGAAASLGRARGGAGRSREARPILDNLAQFRFWSGWRGAAFRRLHG